MSEPRTRLDQAMTARSLEIRKRWVQIAKEAGITTSALSGIRRGEYKPSAHTAQALEDALQWERGSIEAILGGGDPTPTEVGLRDTAHAQDEITVERKQGNADLAEQLAERLRWFEEDNARRQRENDERIERLENEVRRLGGHSG